ncbi:MAG: class I SAM-dependent methyltransferase [Candidatus Heimdallarchaeota archaeon]
MRTKKKVEEVFDQFAKGYSTGAFAPSRYDRRAAMRFADDITWHFIVKYLPIEKSTLILDAGGGDGYWTQKLVELGYPNIILMDLSQGMLNEAKRRFKTIKESHNVEFVKSDITDMKEFESNSFDYIFSQYDAISLCLEPAKAMNELSRVARSTAFIVVSLDTKFTRVPDLIQAGLIDEAEDLLKTNISYDFEFPQYNLTWEELVDYFEQAGLEVIEVVGAPVFMHQVSEEILEKLEENPQIRKRLLKIEIDYCTNRSLVNFAGHLLMVGKKP